MLSRLTGVALCYVDPATNYYARYVGCAGRRVECTNAVMADRPLTQAEVEEFRAKPYTLVAPKTESTTEVV